MLNVLGVVEPRSADGVLPAWSRKLGGLPLLSWVVRHATDCQRLDKVVVLCRNEDEAQVRGCVPPDVAVFIAGEDRQQAYVDLLKAFPAHGVVRIMAESPFVDPELIDRLVRTADEHPACDYIAFRSGSNRPAIVATLAGFGEFCRTEALRRACAECRNPAERDQVTRHLYAHPEKFSIRLLQAPEGLDRVDDRVGMVCEDDWERAAALVEAHGHDGLDWRRLTPR